MSRVRIILVIQDSQLKKTLSVLEQYKIPWTSIKPEQKLQVTVALAGVVYRLVERGHAVRDISQRTGVSKSTVSRIARDPDKYGLRDRKPLGKIKPTEDIESVELEAEANQ